MVLKMEADVGAAKLLTFKDPEGSGQRLQVKLKVNQHDFTTSEQKKQAEAPFLLGKFVQRYSEAKVMSQKMVSNKYAGHEEH